MCYTKCVIFLSLKCFDTWEQVSVLLSRCHVDWCVNPELGIENRYKNNM